MQSPVFLLACLALVVSELAAAFKEPQGSTKQAALFVADMWLDGLVAQMAAQNLSNGPAGLGALEFKHQALSDRSNDDIARATPLQILTRSGFNHQLHLVRARDGYITQLIRLINPYADPKRLKRPPVAFLHGGFSDPTAFLWASAIQHRPQPWPRQPQDNDAYALGSSNRSLPMMLANQGYDVWLIPTRGCNLQNQGHTRWNAAAKLAAGNHNNRRAAWQALASGNSQVEPYWRYSQDEIIQLEYPVQIQKILQVSGARRVSLVAYSMAAQMTMSLLAFNRALAAKVQALILMAPILNNRDTNKLLKQTFDKLAAYPDEQQGLLLYTYFLLTNPIRDALVAVRKELRYTLVWAIETLAFGPSPTFQTLLEAPVLGHLQMPTAFRQIKHWAQQVTRGLLQMFDYGSPQANLEHYNSTEPPLYLNTSSINVRASLVVSGSWDALAAHSSVEQALNLIEPRPKHHEASRYNHLDMVAGADNDMKVNQACLEFLDENQLLDDEQDNNGAEYSKRESDDDGEQLEQYVPNIELGNKPLMSGLASRQQLGKPAIKGGDLDE